MAGNDGSVRLWYAGSGRERAAFAPDALRAAADIVVWDVASARPLLALQQLSWVTALAFRPDGGLLATGHDDGRVRLWDTERRQLVHAEGVRGLAHRALDRRVQQLPRRAAHGVHQVPGAVERRADQLGHARVDHGLLPVTAAAHV